MGHVTGRSFLIFLASFTAVCCLALILVLSGCSHNADKILPAPTLLPGTERTMLTSGFWITRHPFPDSIVLTSDQIAQLNRHIEDDLKTVADLTKKNFFISTDVITRAINKDISELKARPRYISNGSQATALFYDRLIDNIDFSTVGNADGYSYGLITSFSDQRILPTREPLYASPYDVDFDNLQNNALDMGTPVLIHFRSKDGKWAYVRSPESSGWIETGQIARCSPKDVEAFVRPDRFVVITRPKADIYSNSEMTKSLDYVQMGIRLPLLEICRDAYKVLIPTTDSKGNLTQKEGYIRKSQANEGYLPYTARNILHQAFEMLNSPYGWGGMYGEQDCSRFIQQIFATVGINLPRNSYDQGMVGNLIAEFDSESSEDTKNKILKNVPGGIVLLYLKGHIMLYLGKEGNSHHVIHETWAYRAPGSGYDLVYKIGRVAVTDLYLGQRSSNGSLLERLKSVRAIN